MKYQCRELFLIPLMIVLVCGLIFGGCAKPLPPAPEEAPPSPEVAPPIERVAATIDGIYFEPKYTGQIAIGLLSWRNTGDATHDFDVIFYLITPAGVRYGPVQAEEDVRVAPQVSETTSVRLNFEGLPPGTYGVLSDVYDAQTGEIITSRTFTPILTLEFVEAAVPEAPAPTPPAPPTPTQFTLQTVVNPSGGGTVSPSSGTYDSGTMLYLIATPSPGYQFTSWSGDVPEGLGLSPDIWIPMDQNRNLQANFALISTPTPTPTPEPTEPTTSPPSAPSNLNAPALSSSSIFLAWNDNAYNETGFRIERSQSSSGGFTLIDTVGAGVTTFNDTGLNASTTYYYRVVAYNSAGNSAPSNTASATTNELTTSPLSSFSPSAPSNLNTQALSSSSIRLAWNDNSDNETGFRIERSQSSSGGFSLIGTVGAGVTTFNDTGLNAGTTYYYRVVAYNSAGNSAPSNTASATTDATPSFTLTVRKSGVGSGTVTGPGINCGTDCSEEYTAGTSVTLTATAAGGSTFASWAGCDSSSGGSCTLLMDQDKLVTATFNLSFSTAIEITNLPATDTDGNYTLEWTVSGFVVATTIYIHEDSSPAFSSPEQITLTNLTGRTNSYSFSGKADGTYFYRVGMDAGGQQVWSEPASITVARPSSAILRIVNNTHYYMIDIRLNGYQMVDYPYGIPVGEYYDFVFDTPGSVSYYLGVGFYDEWENRDVWFTYQGQTPLYAGQTTTVTFPNPTIGELLSGFNQNGRDWVGQYYCDSCPIIYNLAKFHFGYNGNWTFYDNDQYVGSGSVILTSWPDYSPFVSFKFSPTDEGTTMEYPFGIFMYRNGPPDQPIIEYVAQ